MLRTLLLQVSHGPVGDVRAVRRQGDRVGIRGRPELSAGSLPQGSVHAAREMSSCVALHISNKDQAAKGSCFVVKNVLLQK